MIQFKEKDISRLISACKIYQDQTGSEYMWEEYECLIKKLKNYEEDTQCSDCIICDLHR